MCPPLTVRLHEGPPHRARRRHGRPVSVAALRLLSTCYSYDDVASMIEKYQTGAIIGTTSLKRLIRDRQVLRGTSTSTP